MRTCVIGGSGFIGRHVVPLLIDDGRDVVVLGRRSGRVSELHRKAEYRSCDYNSREQLRGFLQGCGEVIDLAYATVPQTSFADPMFDLQANLPASVGLLNEACGLRGLERILIVSSGGTVYGPTKTLPISEDAPTEPVSPYGITKLTIERYALMYHRLQMLPVVIVRPANAYGLGQKPFTGQGFMATAMGHILKKQELIIFGENGTVRDYIHVKDVAAGIVAALNRGVSGEVYNVGSSIGRNNMDIVRAIEPLATADGYNVKVNIQPARRFDVLANVLDSTKLTRTTGWVAKVPLTDGLSEMWKSISTTFPRD
jgi:UDP-glucose 4-epimerase